jgi:hypothetical protein
MAFVANVVAKRPRDRPLAASATAAGQATQNPHERPLRDNRGAGSSIDWAGTICPIPVNGLLHPKHLCQGHQRGLFHRSARGSKSPAPTSRLVRTSTTRMSTIQERTSLNIPVRSGTMRDREHGPELRTALRVVRHHMKRPRDL